jgi:hypothetical protein
MRSLDPKQSQARTERRASLALWHRGDLSLIGQSIAAMRDFVETKPFGATCTGLAAAATGYVAGCNDWLLIAFAAMCSYSLIFRGK